MLDDKLMLFSMGAARSGPCVTHKFPIAPEYIRTVCFIALAPAAEADKRIELRPVREGIVRGMINHHAAAAAHIVQEGLARGIGPVVAGIVQDDHIVTGEDRRKRGHITTLRRRKGDIHLE
ncbi:MAG: hypothetical protein BWY09_02269 [Candidatus Hydrogenedentes bacterium ADurb.Bin179]|nr:MAG: hypothetical protein BWY09_02269 [Candidatus Hydrogenedentes bacterium ADurb.Bin179]